MWGAPSTALPSGHKPRLRQRSGRLWCGTGWGQDGTTVLTCCSEPPGTRTPQDQALVTDHMCFSLPQILLEFVTGVVKTKPNQTKPNNCLFKSNSSRRNLLSIGLFFFKLAFSSVFSFFVFFFFVMWFFFLKILLREELYKDLNEDN